MIITTYHKSRPLDAEHITGSTDTAPSLNAMFKRLFQGGPVSGEDSFIDELARHGWLRGSWKGSENKQKKN